MLLGEPVGLGKANDEMKSHESQKKTDAQENQKLLTVIIPMWNSERFICRTLRSLICQPCADRLSILCVDDGSQDGTAEICEALKKESTVPIWVLRKEHGGVSRARNAGIQNATTPYICFLDSDDCWESDVFNKDAVALLEAGKDDMIGFGWRTSNQAGTTIQMFPSMDGEITGGYEAVQQGERHFASYFYRSSYLEKRSICFLEGVQYNEDEVFLSMCLYFARTVRLVKPILFSNMLRQDSLRHQRFPGMGAEHLFVAWAYAWHFFDINASHDKKILQYCLAKLDKYVPRMRVAGEMSEALEAEYQQMCILTFSEEPLSPQP